MTKSSFTCFLGHFMLLPVISVGKKGVGLVIQDDHPTPIKSFFNHGDTSYNCSFNLPSIFWTVSFPTAWILLPLNNVIISSALNNDIGFDSYDIYGFPLVWSYIICQIVIIRNRRLLIGWCWGCDKPCRTALLNWTASRTRGEWTGPMKWTLKMSHLTMNHSLQIIVYKL